MKTLNSHLCCDVTVRSNIVRVSKFSKQNPPNCYSKLAQLRFEGGIPLKITFRGVNIFFFSGVPLVKVQFHKYHIIEVATSPGNSVKVAQFHGKTAYLVILNIVSTTSSFSLNLFENSTSNCAVFVNKSAVKWREQMTKFLLTRSGSLLKIHLIHSLLILGSEERQCKDCLSKMWHCTTSCCLQSTFIIWFLCKPARSPLVNTNRWVGLNR